jgi:hypothetical protein
MDSRMTWGADCGRNNKERSLKSKTVDRRTHSNGVSFHSVKPAELHLDAPDAMVDDGFDSQ